MNENWPKISIVTPSYNQGDFLEETILSVINQQYPNLEYVIIDGGSTDNSKEIIKKHEKKLTYWVSEKDNGQTEAINKGYKLLTGDIFNWLNSDDFLEEGALFKIAEEFIKNKKLDVLAFNFNEVDKSSKFVKKHNGTQLLKPIEKSVGYIRPLIQPATFFKMDKIKAIFPLKESLHYAMDFEMWTRFIINYPDFIFFKSDDTIVNFRIHSQSKTDQNYTSNLPSDSSNKFLQEINSIMLNLTNDLYLKKILIKHLISIPIKFEYSSEIINKTNTRKIVYYYFENISEILYASENKNDIIISRKILLWLILKFFSFKYLFRYMKSISPFILALKRQK